jgi:hypothetical protein
LSFSKLQPSLSRKSGWDFRTSLRLSSRLQARLFQDEGLRGEFIRINPAIDELKKLGKAEREISLSEVADLSILKEAERELGIMTAR